MARPSPSLRPGATALSRPFDPSGPVAIVDDDAAIRRAFRFAMRVVGREAIDFASAEEFLAADPGRFACIIMDQHMPFTTGLQLAERLRDMGCASPILLMSGDLSPYVVDRASDLGIERVFDKPVALDDIIAFMDAANGP